MKHIILLLVYVLVNASPALAGYRVTNSRVQEKTVSMNGAEVTMRMVEAYFLDTDTNEIKLVLGFKRKDNGTFSSQQKLLLTNSNAMTHKLSLEFSTNNTIAYAFVDKSILDSHTTASFLYIGFQYPVDLNNNWSITEDFNADESPSSICKCKHFHSGQDFFYSPRSQAGKEIRAIADGQLIYIKDMGKSAGLQIVLRHTMQDGEIIDSSYLHLASLCKEANGSIVANDDPANLGNVICSKSSNNELTAIGPGDTVKQGDVIGQTAKIVVNGKDNPHLHLEIRKNPPQGQNRSLSLIAPTETTIKTFDKKTSIIDGFNFYLNDGCGYGCYQQSPADDGFVRASSFIDANQTASFNFDLVLFQY